MALVTIVTVHMSLASTSHGYTPESPEVRRMAAGGEVPEQSMVDVVNYVIRVQDPSGGWPCQGRGPGGYNRVPQPSFEIKRARCAAGLGSLYVGADFLGLVGTRKERTASSEDLPPALVPVREREQRPVDQGSGGVPIKAE